MDFLLIALLTLLNGVFAMSELALASSRKARLLALAEEGDRRRRGGAEAAGAPDAVPVHRAGGHHLDRHAQRHRRRGRVQRRRWPHWLQGYGVPAGAAGIAATAIVVTAITFVTIIFGELVPKRIGQLYPEPVSRWVARPMAWLATAAGPFVQLLSATTQAVLKLLRIDTTQPRGMTEEEIAHSLEEGVDAGVIEQHEHQMVRNVFHLDDRAAHLDDGAALGHRMARGRAARVARVPAPGAARAVRTPGTRCAAARSTTWSAWSAWRACCRWARSTTARWGRTPCPPPSCPRR